LCRNTISAISDVAVARIETLEDLVDEVLERIVDFAASVTYDALPEEAIRAAKERIMDSVACSVGAWGSAGAEIGRKLATMPPAGGRAGRIVGSPDTVSAHSAAFVNGCLVRDLDFNDTYPGGHPSDGISAFFAVAPEVGADGKDLIVATVILYEIFIRLQMAGQLREKGWDNGFGVGVGVSAGLARLFGADREQLRHAVSITATANVPMRATRAGMLSMWKAAATAFAVESAVRATELALAGMTGPEAPFTGRHGLVEQVTGEIDLPTFGTAGGDYYTPRAKIKYWPVVYNMQAMVWSAIKLRQSLAGRQPRSVVVSTYWSAWHESGSESAKWNPQTRETADHSLPYILAWTLRHGSIGHEAFEPESFLDPTFKPVMDAVTVVIDDEIEKEFPDTIRMRVVATDDEGVEHRVEVVNPLGHEKNPVSDQDLDDKFRRLCIARLGEEATEKALRVWRSIEDWSVADALGAVVVTADLSPVH
jgi:2-methylcitrate dehydratase